MSASGRNLPYARRCLSRVLQASTHASRSPASRLLVSRLLETGLPRGHGHHGLSEPVHDIEASIPQLLELWMVPGAGVEPTWPFSLGILSPLCLPVSPPGPCTIVAENWRRESESNRRTRLCRPLHDHSAIPPSGGARYQRGPGTKKGRWQATFPSKLERERSLELPTSTLARSARHRATTSDTVIIYGVACCCGAWGASGAAAFTAAISL